MNLKAKSQITSDVYLRNFGMWLEYIGKTPDDLITFDKDNFDDFKGVVSDQIRKM